MDYHQNARLTVSLREELARRVLLEKVMLKLAAASFNVSAKTAAKWVRRYREGGAEGLRDRSSRPCLCYRKTPSAFIERVLALRRLRWNGWRIAVVEGRSFTENIAPALGVSYGGRISILPGQSKAEEFSTLVHELAHLCCVGSYVA